jgi:iron(III) transport system permease protein
VVNILLMRTFGLDEPVFNVFSLTGLIVTMGLTLAPVPYLILVGPLSSMDPSLEEASRASGATTWRTIRHVTVPLIRPALLSGLTVCAIIVATAFESPVILGVPGGVHTFMANIYSDMSNRHDFGYASASSMVYLVLIGVLLWWYRWATRVEGRFSLIGGRRQAASRSRLGAWRYVLLAVVLLYLFISFGQLLIAAVYLSLVPFFTTTSSELPPMNLDNYREALGSVGTLPSIQNSLVVATEAAVLVVFAALVLSFVSFKTDIKGRRYAELIGTVPLAFPPLIFSVALLISFLSIPGLRRFYNTPVLLIIGLVIVFLPFGLRVISGSVISIGDELLEASRASGAGMLRTLRSILTPLLIPALASAAGIVFVLSFRELGAVALVVPPGEGLIMTQTFTLWFSGRYGAVHALNVLAFLITAGVMIVTYLAVRTLRYVASRRSIDALGSDPSSARSDDLPGRTPAAVA